MEIKFRAWDKESGRMCEGESLASWIHTARNNGIAEGSVGIKQEPSDARETHLDHLVVMQYTGLKDKNDKEIYEGDIVSTESEPMQIVYCHSGFHLAWPDGGISAPLHPFLIGGLGIEVIGNIYSDKELVHDN